MVGIPESFERLLTYTRMGGRIHEKHAQQHNVASNAACLSVVNLERANRTDLCLLNIEKVDVMGGDVENGKD